MRIARTVTSKGATPRARVLRKSSTPAEALLWRHLRNRQLEGYKFRRQYPVGPYVVDFICHETRLVIEVDGSQHFELSREAADQARTRYLEQHGLRVVRFGNHEVLRETDSVLAGILTALNPSP